MLCKRIIVCLDVKEGRVVKGTQFVNLDDAGDPAELAKRYNDEGADEIVFLDITASHEKRKTMIDVVKKTAKNVFIPLTVGGGISTIEDMQDLLKAGADKVSINTAAVNNPNLIKEAADKFGSQCVVVAIDAKKKVEKNARKRASDSHPPPHQPTWEVYVKGGREATGIDVIEWAKKAEKLGAGEILLTSMDRDGTKEGYDLELTKIISESVNIPVIASGGAGTLESINEVFVNGKADAALAASIFHYGEFKIKDVKKYLEKNKILTRK
jgi:imidazole glycerol-phosphate synthase subunit HisF